VVEVWGVVEEADGALETIFVEEHFQWLAVDEGVVRKIDLARSNIRAGAVAGAAAESCRQGLRTRFER
jgi:hypothetical protein